MNEGYDPTDGLSERAREGLQQFVDMVKSGHPGLQAHREQIEKMGTDLFDLALDTYIDGWELAKNGDSIAAAAHAGRFYAWVIGLDEQERYQLIKQLIKQLLELTVTWAEVADFGELRELVRKETEEDEAREGLPEL